MNRKDVNFHLFMIILSAMIECECPHMYGRKGGEMCPLAEQTTEVGAPGHLNFSCEALPDLTVGASVLSVIRSAKPRTECPLENHSSRRLTSGAFWCWGKPEDQLDFMAWEEDRFGVEGAFCSPAQPQPFFFF